MHVDSTMIHSCAKVVKMVTVAVHLLALLAQSATMNEAGFVALFGTSDFVAPTCASTKTVTSAADSGTGSLREALGMLKPNSRRRRQPFAAFASTRV
ncbi:unnamed protein product [Vitrella brassicaformis CCMP3155]|uniref:Uncharacterized protein n=1 Tax=Vitrella brassicaformis (strain CCMP3155) TaxID=1169540 RepID=A0A0G4EFY7_VITBC|nr:unnamed protein product [Vitrella brassicaformis CCMP3155]|eukprot:CEL94345.1 unnamed protein product [Vitrella brassicaformis CCMP3155]